MSRWQDHTEPALIQIPNRAQRTAQFPLDDKFGPPLIGIPGRHVDHPADEPRNPGAKVPAKSVRQRTKNPRSNVPDLSIEPRPRIQLNVTPAAVPEYLTVSGTYRDGNLTINTTGLRVAEEEPTENDKSSVALEDLEAIRVVGKGASATVQLVQQKWTNHLYALKVMELSGDEALRKSIMQELQINHSGKRFDHVVQYVNSFYANGEISIVFEYMDGGSVADLLHLHGKIGERHLAEIARQALLGLRELHQRHVIHRDIKPSNILVNRRGQVKISDFGVSAVIENTLAQAHTMVGTFIYMSPERIGSNEYGFNSDIWALGLSILECGLGRFPYSTAGGGANQGLSFFQLMEQVVSQPAPQAPPDRFSPEFCSFISTCLQKDAAKRAGALQLLEHPFIRKYQGAGVDVGELCPGD